MKSFIVLSAVFLAVAAKPGFITPYAVIPVAAPIVSSQFHAQDELGQYSYGYSDHLSTKSEIKTADGITQGGYSYVDAEGKLQTVQYVSDAVNGFRVAATNLPVAPVPEKVTPVEAPQPVQDTPEVTEAKARHFEAVKEAEKLAEMNPEEIQEEEKTVVAPVVPLTYAAPAFAYTPYIYPKGHAYSYSTYSYNPYLHSVPVHHPFAYSAHPVYTHYAYAAPQIPAVPLETPEVAKARAEHLAAHEEAKTRNA